MIGSKWINLHHAGFQFRKLVREQFLSKAITRRIGVVVQAVKMPFDPQACRPAEMVNQIGQIQLVIGVRPGIEQTFAAQANRRDGEQLRADVHETAEQQLLALQFRAVPQHRVKNRPRQPPARSRNITQMSGADFEI